MSLLQGDEDKEVPPSQSYLFREALPRKAIPHSYLLVPGEQPDSRKAETIVAALVAELSFDGQVLGFTPPGAVVGTHHDGRVKQRVRCLPTQATGSPRRRPSRSGARLHRGLPVRPTGGRGP